MAPWKWDKLKEWLSSFFTSKAPRDILQHQASFVSRITDFPMRDATIPTVQESDSARIGLRDPNIVPQIMGLLSRHIIQGSAHDSSARSPPPRCHPSTRVKLIARIIAWFDGQGVQEWLLWITGPAGVGKSAIVQTLAEYLVKSESLGASVFISRSNKRNNPHGFFITIAYQLANRIEEYRSFIVERIALDPELLSMDMDAQFATFIVEPFVKRKLGVGGKRWGILLDGLDELQGEDAQCNIIHLISTFVREHRDTPLVWIIASRPESHITNTFDDDEVRRSSWSEYIPIDSTEAYEDTDRFLRSEFEVIRKKYYRSIPRDWPSDTDYLKLAAAASGFFFYAQVVMEFIRDPAHADPMSRFKVLLSVIDPTNISITENPFVYLDALYHEILSSITSTLWPTAKLSLGFTLYGKQILAMNPDIPSNFHTLRGMSLLFGLNQNTIYSCLTKCPSMVKIPGWEVAHKQGLTLLHASFAHYLKDPNRSGDFHVSLKDVEDSVMLHICRIWNNCVEDAITRALVKSMWHVYCSKWDDKTLPSVAKFYATLFDDVGHCLEPASRYIIKRLVESPTDVRLGEIPIVKLRHRFNAVDWFKFVHNLMYVSPTFNDGQLLRQVRLGDLDFGHFDWEWMCPAYAHYGRTGESFTKSDWILRQPRSSAELAAYIHELECFKKRSPKLKVVVFGDVPKERVAAFRRPLDEGAVDKEGFIYYLVPYHE